MVYPDIYVKSSKNECCPVICQARKNNSGQCRASPAPNKARMQESFFAQTHIIPQTFSGGIFYGYTQGSGQLPATARCGKHHQCPARNPA